MTAPGEPTAASSTDLGKTTPAWKGRMVGHFKLLSILGQGAMGKVFRAEDVSLKRHVALKVLPQKVAAGDKTYKLDQFVREARSAATLEHPNVVTIYEVNSVSNVYYIAMELVEGGNLDELVKASGPMDMVRACQLCAEIADALYYAHQHGIIHRDVKPSNLMLTRSGRCKIADFGLAHMDDPNDPFNLPTEAVGTPQYVAPEVAQGTPATALSDVYSLGATLWFLLTGAPPFKGGSKKELLKQHIAAPLPDLKKLRPDLPDSLVKALHTAMAKEPAERFASADVFAKVLRAHTIPVGTMSNLGMSGSLGPGLGQSSMSLAVAVDPKAARNRKIMIVGGAVAVAIALSIAIFAVVVLIPPQRVVVVKQPTPANKAPVKKRAPKKSAAPKPSETDSGDATVDTANDNSAPKTPPSAPSVTPAPAVVTPAPAPTTQPTNVATDKVFTPDDYDALVAIAKGTDASHPSKDVTISGRFSDLKTSSRGTVTKATLAGSGSKGVAIVWFPKNDFFTAMEKAFGGAAGAGLEGKRAKVSGEIKLYNDEPEIIVNSTDQIKVED